MLTILLLGGCGYQNPYLTNGSVPSNARTIYLTMWPNRTNEFGLEAKIFRSQSRWFQKSGNIKLVGNRKNADFILTAKYCQSTCLGCPTVCMIE